MEITLDSSFERQGEWFTHNHPDRKVSGTITFSQEDGGYLDLYDTLLPLKKGVTNPSKEMLQFQVIFGNTTKGEYITIFSGTRVRYSVNMNSGKAKPTEGYHCYQIVIGAILLPDLRCTLVDFHIPELLPWLNQKTIKSSSDYDQTQQVWNNSYEYIGSSNKTISLDKNFAISWRTTWRDNSDDYSRIDMELYKWMSIEHKSGQPLDWFIAQSSKIGALVTLLAGTTISPRTIKFSVPEYRRDCYVLMKLPYIWTDSGKKPFHFFLTQQVIDEGFEEILKKWFGIYDKSHDSINLTLGVLSSKDLWLHVRFLSLMHALEGFHRSKYSGLYTTPEKYENVKSLLTTAMPQHLSSSHRESLKNRIRYGNEISLHKRLDDLASSLTEDIRIIVLGESKTPRIWVDTRNYYTHWDVDLKNQILKGTELHHVCKRLEALLRILWIQETGVASDTILTALNGSNDLALSIQQINNWNT